MNNVSRTLTLAGVAAGLLLGSALASAQSRQQVVTRPATVEVKNVVAPTATPTPAAVIIITPAPLPSLPPNFCNRGNSGGVSRC